MKTLTQLEVDGRLFPAILKGQVIYVRVPIVARNTNVRRGAFGDVNWTTARSSLQNSIYSRGLRALKIGRGIARYLDVTGAWIPQEKIWLQDGDGRGKQLTLVESISAMRLQDMTDWDAVQHGALTIWQSKDAVQDILMGQTAHRRRLAMQHLPSSALTTPSPRQLFAARWDTEHSQRAIQWKANPWTWQLRLKTLGAPSKV